MRVVSDILESNGSSSIGFDLRWLSRSYGRRCSDQQAGCRYGYGTYFRLENPNGRYAILTDILGDEDHLGDMDFKVAGTKDGITATQMDIKVDGLSYEVLAGSPAGSRRQNAHHG